MKTVVTWLLEYALKMKHTRAVRQLHKLLKSCNEEESNLELGVPPIRHTVGILHDIVQSGDVQQFDLARRLVENIMSTAEGLVPCMFFMRIISGLKILVLFHHLQESDRMMLAMLNQYFPGSGVPCGSLVLPRDVELTVNAAQKDFRQLFLSLLANQEQRRKYFEKQMEKHYGGRFKAKVLKLISELLSKVEEALPPTQIEKIFSWGIAAERVEQLVSAEGEVAVQALLDAIIMHDKEQLSEDDILKIIDTLTELQKDPEVPVRRKASGAENITRTATPNKIVHYGATDVGTSSSRHGHRNSSGIIAPSHTVYDQTQHRKSRRLRSPDDDSHDNTASPRSRKR